MIDSYNKLPFGKYAELCEISASDADLIDKNTSFVSVLNDIPEEELLQLPIAEYKRLSEGLKFLDEELPKPNARQVATRYVVGKWVLVPCMDIENMTAGQYIDFQNIVKTGDGLSIIPKVLSCLMVPEGKRYMKDYSPTEIQKAVNDYLSIVDTQNLYAFFLSRWGRYLRTMLTYCKLMVRLVPMKREQRKKYREQTKIVRDLLKNGVGSLGLIRFPRPCAYRGTMSLSEMFWNS